MPWSAAPFAPSAWRYRRRTELLVACCWWLLRSALVLWVALVLVAWGPLTTAVWQRGGHATSDQWVYHMAFERLGLHQHHGGVLHGYDGYGPHSLSPETADPNLAYTQAIADQILHTLLATTPAKVIAPISPALIPQTLWHLITTGTLALPDPAVERTLDWRDPPVHEGIIPPPPEKPPAAHS